MDVHDLGHGRKAAAKAQIIFQCLNILTVMLLIISDQWLEQIFAHLPEKCLVRDEIQKEK